MYFIDINGNRVFYQNQILPIKNLKQAVILDDLLYCIDGNQLVVFRGTNRCNIRKNVKKLITIRNKPYFISKQGNFYKIDKNICYPSILLNILKKVKKHTA